MSRPGFVGLGYISGVHGLRGWVKVFSYTQPREQILEYPTWHIGTGKTLDAQDSEFAIKAKSLEAGHRQGKGIVAKLTGVEDRDAAAALNGCGIFVPRAELPDAEPGEYYWADLAGLEVHNSQGQVLGSVDHLLETGAHDVMVLAEGANRLIPFVPGRVVLDVDLERGVITVDWDAAWWE